MYLQLRVSIVGKNRKGCVSSARPYFEKRLRPSVFLGNLGQNGKLLLKPFSIFEKVGRIVLIELIPPFRRVAVESAFTTVSAYAACIEPRQRDNGCLQSCERRFQVQSDGSERLVKDKISSVDSDELCIAL